MPSLNPQDAFEEDKTIVGPGKFNTVTGTVFTHKFASLTYRVYEFAAMPLKILPAW